MACDNPMALSLFCYKSAVRGHHISKDFWIPTEGEMLSCVRGTTNQFDLFAVAVKKDGISTLHGSSPSKQLLPVIGQTNFSIESIDILAILKQYNVVFTRVRKIFMTGS